VVPKSLRDQHTMPIGDQPFEPPPPPRPIELIDPSEFIALRTIVAAMVALMATEYEKSTGSSAQGWINRVAVECHQAIRSAEIGAADPERIRSKAVDYVNHILGGITFPRDPRSN
jgi:hypothetical protein